MQPESRQPQAWTIEHIETANLDEAQREDGVSALAILINTWNEMQRSAQDSDLIKSGQK
ncbi:hypothetical protein GCM10017774_82930 [Lentzea cavernae]|uniref:Uncharacterized protein n=1 Tax=Lentzea cavernae TaxID=2020703 RepID=A0ABQ3MYP0_9PSEU|nr:hypothetical protein GCM10017774_82930 [Lentzea cavernae]